MLSNCFKILMVVCVHIMSCTLGDCNNIRRQMEIPKNTVSPKFADESQKKTVSNEVTKQRRRCCPYDFDSRICRTVGDRFLCGFNKNIGRPQSNDDEISINGCRIRGGRIECGYKDVLWTHGPYTNPRRPLPYDTKQQGSSQTDAVDSDDSPPVDINQIDKNMDPKENLIMHYNVTKYPLNNGVTKCVEIDKRIVCRPT